MSKETDEKILEQFPEYDGKPEHFVGSKLYWQGIFECETNRNPELHTAFGKLHEKLVNEVIEFCRENNLTNIDEVVLRADGLMDSIEYGKWGPCTDSSMTLIDTRRDANGWVLPNREKPFLTEF